MNSLKQSLQRWNTTNDSFTKLQHAYVTIALSSLVIAGIISLINYNLGQSLLFVAMCASLVFIGNGVVWALVRTFVVTPTPKPTTPVRKK